MTENTNQNEEVASGEGARLMKEANKAFSTAERYNAQKTWSLLAEFILPSANREWFGDISKGIRRDRRLFDSTAIMANRDLASAMHSVITNPTMHWAKLSFRSPDANDSPEGTHWLDQTIETFHTTISDSNFDVQMSKCYPAFSSLGNMILFQDEEFNFTAWHLAEVAWTENNDGRVDKIYRKFKMTLDNAFDKFGEAIGTDMMEKLKTDPLFELDFFHVIVPRDKKLVRRDSATGLSQPTERPFACYYIMQRGAKIVQEDGYYEFPVYVTRWANLPGEVYGFGPGHTALSDIRTLNKLKEQTLNALAKSINPPILTMIQNMISGDMRPGGINVVRDASPNAFREFITQTRFDISQLSVQELQGMIKSVFYIDKLLLPPREETGEMTAYEVAQRLQQMQQILGPVLSKLNYEFLNPLVIRSLNILARQKKIKPLPSVAATLNGATPQGGRATIDFDVLFVNQLARSQQMSELQNVEQWVQEAMQAAQGGMPQALDKINIDAVIDYSAKIRSIPEHMVVSEADVQKLRQQRQQQQQAAQNAATAQAGASAINQLGQAHAAVKSADQGGGE